MDVHGCIKTLIICCAAALVPGCSQRGSGWGPRSANNPIAPWGIPDQRSSQAVTQATLDAPKTAKHIPNVAQRVDDYIDSFAQRDNLPPSVDIQAKTVRPKPIAGHFSDESAQAGSMSAASLDGLAKSTADGTAHRIPMLPVPTSISVRAVQDEYDTADLPQATVANRAVEIGRVAAGSSIQQVIEQLEEDVAEQPSDLRKQLRLRYLYLSEGLTERALALPKEMGAEQAVLLVKMMKSVVAIDNTLQNPTMVSPENARTVRELQDWFQSNADLEIPRAALCTKIHSFGRFEAIPEGFFVSGGPNRALLYCEVKNFTTETTADGQYRTRIAHRLELLTPQGHSVWKDPEALEVEDLCMNPRNDFFFNRLVQLPLGINPGDYVLKVTVEDRIRSRVDETRIFLEIRPAGSARQ